MLSPLTLPCRHYPTDLIELLLSMSSKLILMCEIGGSTLPHRLRTELWYSAGQHSERLLLAILDRRGLMPTPTKSQHLMQTCASGTLTVGFNLLLGGQFKTETNPVRVQSRAAQTGTLQHSVTSSGNHGRR